MAGQEEIAHVALRIITTLFHAKTNVHQHETVLDMADVQDRDDVIV